MRSLRYGVHLSALSASIALLCGALSSAHAALTITNIAHFQGSTSGAFPQSPLVQGHDGQFYGTTMDVAACNQGAFYRMSSSGAITVLASFGCSNVNALVVGGILVQGHDGAFYGTSQMGGDYGFGMVFRATTNGIVTPVLMMDGTNTGAKPVGLVIGKDGSLYGTTISGGPGFNGSTTTGGGTIFRIETNSNVTVWYPFGSTNDLTTYGLTASLGFVDDENSLYGTTLVKGVWNAGTVFKMSTNGTMITLFSFDGTNGLNPNSLVRGVDGSFYGTTHKGGNLSAAYPKGNGTVFRLTTNGVHTTLHAFNKVDGDGPGEIIQGNDGNLYGTSAFNKATFATVFQISTSGTSFATVHSFSGLPAGITQGRDGNFYGVSALHGLYNNGYVYKISMPLRPVLQQPAPSGSNLDLTWSSVAGQTYQLQYNTDLSSTNWNNLGSSAVATNGTMSASDDIVSGTQRFYRVVLLP
jgi:uncharacterized repeat protein (TIGR03803 family)